MNKPKSHHDHQSTQAASTPATGAPGHAGTGGTGGTGRRHGHSSSGASSTTAANGVTLGGTDFLTLMLAQLQNQDPTSPVDSNEFLSQLASLERGAGHHAAQHLVHGTVEFARFQPGPAGLLAARPSGARRQLDRHARAAPAARCHGAVSVPQTSSQVVLNITNSSGVLVQSLNLGAQSAGLANFSWNGQTSNGSAAPPGTYTLSAQVARRQRRHGRHHAGQRHRRQRHHGLGHDRADVEHRRARQRAVLERSADFKLIHSRSTHMATFSIALSGLTAANSALDITSNNIANADTIGFKNSQAEFDDVYASGAVNLNSLDGRRGRAARRRRTAVHSGQHHHDVLVARPGDQRQRLLHAERPDRQCLYPQRRNSPRMPTATW